ncbi:MAG: HNH endonuclease [Cyclobacteriaceae bacterium]|nr:HNH endonuclease [Cyclobacteriaceae bacterium]
MNSKTRYWTRQELILALYLYYITPFSKISASSNNDIKELASRIERSASAVALKLVNFASLDSSLQRRNISGMKNASKADMAIWKEFNQQWENLIEQREKILFNLSFPKCENGTANNFVGMEKEVTSKGRVNQSFFRNAVLSAYDYQCCITGLSVSEILIASHIIPWAVDEKNRLNPSNGLCMNPLHDRAFDVGLITITPELKIKVSKTVKQKSKSFEDYFRSFENQRIRLPNKFLPKPEFLDYHNSKIFRK